MTIESRCIPALCIAAMALVMPGCSAESGTDEPRPQQAGQPMSPVENAARVAAIRGAALRGDREVMQRHAETMAEEFRRSIRLADPARAVDRESARIAARQVPGVRSAVWLDIENFFVRVDSVECQTQGTIDRICLALEPLGDTLGVVVNLQNSSARNGRELANLSRNCQLSPGERALLSRERVLDPIDPRIRAQHEANQALAQQSEEELARQAESVRVLQRTTQPLQR